MRFKAHEALDKLPIKTIVDKRTEISIPISRSPTGHAEFSHEAREPQAVNRWTSHPAVTDHELEDAIDVIDFKAQR